MYKLTLYAVQTYGGQIIDGHEPRAVVLDCWSLNEKKVLRNLAKKKNLFSDSARYFATEKDARAAIRLALCN